MHIFSKKLCASHSIDGVGHVRRENKAGEKANETFSGGICQQSGNQSSPCIQIGNRAGGPVSSASELNQPDLFDQGGMACGRIGPMELDINRNGKIVHKMACASLQKQLELFLNLHGELMCYVTEALRDGSKDLVPGLCPPELLDRLHQILKIPYDNDLLALVRRILVACESNANAEDPGVTR
jgi:hypothetical protein